jgi:hypothetical protein
MDTNLETLSKDVHKEKKESSLISKQPHEERNIMFEGRYYTQKEAM